jgi:hypothetical protein
MTEPTAQTKIEKSRNLARIQTYKLYYESKLACLSNKRLSPTLHRLACKDAPVERDNLDSSWQRGRYITRCLRYYKKKLNELEKELKKIK